MPFRRHPNLVPPSYEIYPLDKYSSAWMGICHERDLLFSFEWVDVFRWRTSWFFFLKCQLSEMGETKNMHCFLFFEGCQTYCQKIGFNVKEVNNMLSSMTLVGLYSLRLSFSVIFIYWCGSGFPKIMLLISLLKSLKAYSLKNMNYVKKCLWETQPIHDVKMYREGRAVCPHPGCKPHNNVSF